MDDGFGGAGLICHGGGMTKPPLADVPIRSADELTARWTTVLDPLVFTARSLWLTWIDHDGMALRVVLPIDDIPGCQDPEMLKGPVRCTWGCPGHLPLGGLLAMALCHPGQPEITEDDEAWAEALRRRRSTGSRCAPIRASPRRLAVRSANSTPPGRDPSAGPRLRRHPLRRTRVGMSTVEVRPRLDAWDLIAGCRDPRGSGLHRGAKVVAHVLATSRCPHRAPRSGTARRTTLPTASAALPTEVAPNSAPPTSPTPTKPGCQGRRRRGAFARYSQTDETDSRSSRRQATSLTWAAGGQAACASPEFDEAAAAGHRLEGAATTRSSTETSLRSTADLGPRVTLAHFSASHEAGQAGQRYE